MPAAARVYQLPPLESEEQPEASAARDAAATVARPMAELAADWLAARAQYEAEFARLQTAETAAFALHPDIPAAIRDHRHTMWPASDEELRRRDEARRSLTWPRPTDNPHIEASRRWQEQSAAIDSSFGVKGLEEAAERAAQSVGLLAKQIIAMRPTTSAEAAIKFGVLLETYQDGHGGIDDPKPIFAFLADLEALAAIERGGQELPAAPPSREVLEAYNAWLFYERRLLAMEMYPEHGTDAERWVTLGNPGDQWHFQGPGSWRDKPQPSSRAAFVLRAMGVLPEDAD